MAACHICALFVVTAIANLLFSGAIFGWATIQLILESDGVFLEVCPEGTSPMTGCALQRVEMNFVYSVASTVVIAASLAAGMLVDLAGPIFCMTVSGFAICSGSLLMATAGEASTPSSRWTSHPLLGAVLLGFGGVLTFMSSFTVGFLFPPKQMDAAVTTFSILFDTSGAVPLLLWLSVYRLEVPSKTVWICYAALAGVTYGAAILLWCMSRCADARNSSSDVQKPNTSGGTNKEVKSKDQSPGYDSTSLPIEERPLSSQLLSCEFFIAVVFSCFNVLKSNVYLGSNKELLSMYGDEKRDFAFTTIFAASVAVSAPFAPCIAAALVRFGFAWCYQFVNILAIGWGSLCLVPILEVQPVSFVLYSFFRALFYSVQCAWHARKFGSKNVGRMHGVVFLLAGCVNYVQQPIISYLYTDLEGDLRPFFVALLATTLPYVGFTFFFAKKINVVDIAVTSIKQQSLGEAASDVHGKGATSDDMESTGVEGNSTISDEMEGKGAVQGLESVVLDMSMPSETPSLKMSI